MPAATDCEAEPVHLEVSFGGSGVFVLYGSMYRDHVALERQQVFPVAADSLQPSESGQEIAHAAT